MKLGKDGEVHGRVGVVGHQENLFGDLSHLGFATCHHDGSIACVEQVETSNLEMVHGKGDVAVVGWNHVNVIHGKSEMITIANEVCHVEDYGSMPLMDAHEEVNVDFSFNGEHSQRDPRCEVQHAMSIYGCHVGELKANEERVLEVENIVGELKANEERVLEVENILGHVERSGMDWWVRIKNQ